MPLKPSKLALLFVLLLAVSGCEQRSVDLETARSAVFKIQVTSSEPNFVEPWKRVAPSSSSGTGFYIGKDRILTNAHVIAGEPGHKIPIGWRLSLQDKDRAARRGQDDTANILATSSAKRLEQRIVFAINRQHRCPRSRCTAHEQCAGANEAFFIGERHSGAALDRRHGRF